MIGCVLQTANRDSAAEAYLDPCLLSASHSFVLCD
jgi:hypothetical protein